MGQYNKAIAAFITLLVTLLAQWGVEVDEGNQQVITDSTISLVGGIATIVAVWAVRNDPKTL